VTEGALPSRCPVRDSNVSGPALGDSAVIIYPSPARMSVANLRLPSIEPDERLVALLPGMIQCAMAMGG
jgi:hypothetical protein